MSVVPASSEFNINDFRLSRGVYYVLFDYIKSCILICTPKRKRSYNSRLISALSKLYQTYTSVEHILGNSFKLEALSYEYLQEKKLNLDFETSAKKNMCEKIVMEAKFQNSIHN